MFENSYLLGPKSRAVYEAEEARWVREGREIARLAALQRQGIPERRSGKLAEYSCGHESKDLKARDFGWCRGREPEGGMGRHMLIESWLHFGKCPECDPVQAEEAKLGLECFGDIRTALPGAGRYHLWRYPKSRCSMGMAETAAALTGIHQLGHTSGRCRLAELSQDGFVVKVAHVAKVVCLVYEETWTMEVHDGYC